MMVVIAIIGILAGIAINGFQLYIKKAYNVTVRNDLKNFAGAQKEYYTGRTWKT